MSDPHSPDVTSAELDYHEDSDIIVLTMVCRDQDAAGRLFEELASGLKRGKLVIAAGQPAEVVEAISGGAQ